LEEKGTHNVMAGSNYDGFDILWGNHIHEDWFERCLFDGFAIGSGFVFIHSRPHDLSHVQMSIGRIKRFNQILYGVY